MDLSKLKDILRITEAQYFRFSFSSDGGPISHGVLNSHGLYSSYTRHRTVADLLRKISKEEAVAIAEIVLYRDLALQTKPQADMTETKMIARNLVDTCSENDTKYYTNGSWIDYFDNSGHFSWNSLTDATFDGGVILVNSNYSVAIWAQAED